MRNGLTLIELAITIVMIVILAGVASYLFRAVLISWSGQEIRAGIDITLDRGIEEIVRELREARKIDSPNDDEIRFSTDNTNYNIYYLYNQDDAYPPTFSQDSYQLRKAALAGGINGTFAYDAGRIILSGVLPPDTSDLSIDGNMVIIDLSVRRGNETIRSRTEVRPRNL